MSASLVGSEMCIRDRVGTTNGFFSLGHFSSSNLRSGLAPAPRVARRPGCLLYTSDAADDM
eukprot:2551577-Alexandrium_andersonii.AAC.1